MAGGGGARPADMAPPPDGGWGWVVVLAAFCLQALTIGITYTFGVAMIAFLDEFDQPEAIVSWIGSIQSFLLYLTGFVTGPLIQKFGWRAVTVAGSLLSAAGFIASGYAPNVYVLYFTYGVLTGIGNGLMYVTSMVTVQFYFDKKRATATGLAISGSGIGTLVFGFLTQFLIDEFDWPMALKIEGVIMLFGAFCGLFFRPLSVPKTVTHGDDDIHKLQHTISTENSCKYAKFPDNDDDSDDSDYGVKAKEGCCAGFGEACDFGLFKNPLFIAFCVAIICFCFGYQTPFAYTPQRAVMLGIPKTDAAFLVSVMGIANVAGRPIFGAIADRSPNVRFIMASVTLSLGGVVSCFISFFNDYPSLCAYSAMFGAFTGCWAAVFPVVLVDLLGVEVIGRSLGQAMATGSFAFLVGAPLAGWIISETGSYDAPFQVVGAIEALGGVILFFTLCINKTRGQRKPGYIDIDQEKTERGSEHQRRRFVSESFS